MGNKVVILSFSGRKNGNCTAISDYITEHYKRTNVLACSIDNETFPACGGCDYECLKPYLICPALNETQKEILDAIMESDIVYWIVPNICGYPGANYFAFNERLVGYFNLDRVKQTKYMNIRKRFIIVSNTEGNVFEEAMRRQTNNEPKLLYLKTGKYGKQSIAGDLLTSEAAVADLQAFLELEHL